MMYYCCINCTLLGALRHRIRINKILSIIERRAKEKKSILNNKLHMHQRVSISRQNMSDLWSNECDCNDLIRLKWWNMKFSVHWLKCSCKYHVSMLNYKVYKNNSKQYVFLYQVFLFIFNSHVYLPLSSKVIYLYDKTIAISKPSSV